MTIVIENYYYKNLVVTEIFRLPTFNYESFPKPTPPQTQNCHLGAFQEVEKNFFRFDLNKILGLQIILD